MLVQRLSDARQNRELNLFIVLTLLGLVCSWMLYTYVTAPSQSSFNGTYRSPCCSDIVIRNGRISQGGTALQIRLLNMKFGLTGYVDGEFTSTGLRASSTETAITLSGERERRQITLPIGGRTFTFELVTTGVTTPK